MFTLGKVCGFYSNIFLASLSIAFLGVSENITLFRISGPKGVYVHDGGSSQAELYSEPLSQYEMLLLCQDYSIILLRNFRRAIKYSFLLINNYFYGLLFILAIAKIFSIRYISTGSAVSLSISYLSSSSIQSSWCLWGLGLYQNSRLYSLFLARLLFRVYRFALCDWALLLYGFSRVDLFDWARLINSSSRFVFAYVPCVLAALFARLREER